jgi:hypothetical protein
MLMTMTRHQRASSETQGLPGFEAKRGPVELIYFSESKLSAFIPARAQRRRSFPRKVDIKFSAVGFIAELAVDMEPEPLGPLLVNKELLRKVVNDIRSIAKIATDESVRPGDWIFFECDLTYSSWHSKDGRWSGVLFLGRLERPDKALALHGSTSNLVPRPGEDEVPGRFSFTSWDGLAEFVAESGDPTAKDDGVTANRLSMAVHETDPSHRLAAAVSRKWPHGGWRPTCWREPRMPIGVAHAVSGE